MASGISRTALLRRTAPLAFSLSLALYTMHAPQASAQSPEGTVRLIPALSSIPAKTGPFTVFVVLEGLEHYGVVQYDDNRDTAPDRQVESVGLAAFEVTIEFDDTVIAFEGVEPGPALGRTGRVFQCLPTRKEPGRVSFGCLSLESEPAGPQGSLTLASVQFRPLASGSSALTLDSGLSGPLGDSMAIDVSGGLVRVTGALPPTEVQPAALASTATVAAIATTVEFAATPMTAGPASASTPSSGDGARSLDVPVEEAGDLEARSVISDTDEGASSRKATFWVAVGSVGVVAVSAASVGAWAWRSRRRAGGA